MRSARVIWAALGLLGVAVAWYVADQLGARVAPRTPRAPGTVRTQQSSAPSSAEPPVLPAAPPASPNPASVQPPVATAAGTSPVPSAAAAAISSPAEPAASPTPPSARIEADKVRLMIRGYHDVMGENPVGTNAEIMQALMGRNPKQAQLGPPEGQSLNAQGELVDQWGTPFFFHQLSRDAMEIRSAGPDKILGTPDDVVAR